MLIFLFYDMCLYLIFYAAVLVYYPKPQSLILKNRKISLVYEGIPVYHCCNEKERGSMSTEHTLG